MTRALVLAALVALAPACADVEDAATVVDLAPPRDGGPSCEGTYILPDGKRLGTLHVGGVEWRVQIHALPAPCDGMTSWGPLGNSVSFAAVPDRGLALHEIGHALGLHHLADPHAVMFDGVVSQDLTPADLAYCVAAGVCSADAQLPPAPSEPADPIAWAAERWNSVTTPQERFVFTKEAP